MTVEPDVFATPDALGRRAARMIADGLVAAREAGRPYVLGCPGGRSAAPDVRRAGRPGARGAARPVDHLVVVMMDDYLVPGDGRHAARARTRGAALLHPLRPRGDRRARSTTRPAPGRGVRADAPLVPGPGRPGARTTAGSATVGGIDLFLLASGASDGHVAFNPPGAARDSRTRVVELPDSTRRDNLATFPSLRRRPRPASRATG